jgi:phospholipase C
MTSRQRRGRPSVATLGCVAVLVVVSLLIPARATAGAAKPAVVAPHVTGPAQRIKHIVVIYQENHSFDETLGWFCEQRPGRCDGYVGPVTLSDGTVVNMRPSPDIVPQVYHDMASQDAAIDNGKMDGWNHVLGCSVEFNYGCFTYYTQLKIPNLTALASKFVVSDRTFSMQDSPSFGGHVYVAAATQDGFTGELPVQAHGVHPAAADWGCDSKLIASWIDPKTHKLSMQPSCVPARPGVLNAKKYPYNGAFRKTQVKFVPTIFDRLDAKHLSWKLYSSIPIWSICPTFADCEYTKQHLNVVKPTNILQDLAHNKLPAYSLLLPTGPGGTSQHNGSSMVNGDDWIGKVLKRLETSRAWSSTAVFITYDDCGCFYDHVKPGINPDKTRQGVRVPMVIVSPYAKEAFTDSHPATFASILRFAEETFGLKALSTNDAHAYDYRGSFDFAKKPSGPRVAMTQQPVSASSLHYVARHPEDPDDPT